eukprot:UN27503
MCQCGRDAFFLVKSGECRKVTWKFFSSNPTRKFSVWFQSFWARRTFFSPNYEDLKACRVFQEFLFFLQ